jgi:phosphoribosylamine--glycine ligase
MAGKEGVQVIETNARFGDPEAMNVLALLKASLYDVFDKIADAKLSEIEIDWETSATVVKYLVPNGYPEKSVAAEEIYVDSDVLKDSGAQIYFASVEKKEGKIYSGKSRSVAVLGKADTISNAEKIAEVGCTALTGPLWHRGDIGTAELIEKRITHMKQLRGE